MADNQLASIRQNQAEGIAAAKTRGVKFGRPVKAVPDNFVELVAQWERKKLSTEEILEQCKMGYTTFYRRRIETGLKQGINE